MAKDGSDIPAQATKPEAEPLKNPEADAARNAPPAAIAEVEGNRTNASDGSLRDRSQKVAALEESIQIVSAGGVSSRTNKLSEKDLNVKASSDLPGISVQELSAKDDAKAGPILEQFDRIAQMPEGLAKTIEQGRVQDLADRTYERGKYSKETAAPEAAIFNTGQLKKLAGDANAPEESRALAQSIQEMRNQTKALGVSTDTLDDFAKQALGRDLNNLAQTTGGDDKIEIGGRPYDRDQILASSGTKSDAASDATNAQQPHHMAGHKGLSPEILHKAAQAFQAGSQAGQNSIGETADEINRTTSQAYIDTWASTFKVPFDAAAMLLRYDYNLVAHPQKAREDAAAVGNQLGLALFSGMKLSVSLGMYGADVATKNDYGKPLNDVAHSLDAWYQKLSPADQMAIAGNICASFGVVAGAGEINKLGKGGSFVEFLDSTASQIPKNPEAQKHLQEVCQKLLEALSEGKTGRLATAGGEEIEQGFAERRVFKDIHGHEYSPGKAAESLGKEKLGLTKEEFKALSPTEQTKKLVEAGLTLIEPSVYYVAGCLKPLSEKLCAERFHVSIDDLRNMSKADLEKHGANAIECVNGRLPCNYEYAGKFYNFAEKQPAIYEQLVKKYPHDKFPEIAEGLKNGVHFSKEGYADFEPFKVGKANLPDGFHNRNADFFLADKQHWPDIKTAEEGAIRRRQEGLTWHHSEDGHSMLLVPTDLHDNVAHTGGIARTGAATAIGDK